MHNFGPASKQKNLVESNDEILNWVNCLELLETSFYKIKTLYFARIKLGLNQSQHISSTEYHGKIERKNRVFKKSCYTSIVEIENDPITITSQSMVDKLK